MQIAAILSALSLFHRFAGLVSIGIAISLIGCKSATTILSVDKNPALYTAAMELVVSEYHDYRFKKGSYPLIILHDEFTTIDFQNFISISDKFNAICSPILKESVLALTVNNFSFDNQLMHILRKPERRDQQGEYLVFSPIMHSKIKGKYCQLCETSNGESITTRAYLLEMVDRKKMKIVQEIDALSAFY